jgi:PTH1 family peptidyl-tRNA hydrolase
MIRLIIGLGNPGKEYEQTRHNAGAWFVESLALQHHTSLKLESKFKSHVGVIKIGSQECRLCIPITFMNLSGQAVSSIANFYKISPENILVAHDELDFPPGKTRMKFDGSAGGHNGLFDVIKHLGSTEFYRLRIGIGRPEHKDFANYVLNAPSTNEKQQIISSFDKALQAVPQLVSGNIAEAMQAINTDFS